MLWFAVTAVFLGMIVGTYMEHEKNTLLMDRHVLTGFIETFDDPTYHN